MTRRAEAPEGRRGEIPGARGRSCRRGACGQGLTEFLIILALIVIAAIGVYSFFGQSAVRQPPAGAAQKQPAAAKAPDGTPAQAPASAPEPGTPPAAAGVPQTAASK